MLILKSFNDINEMKMILYFVVKEKLCLFLEFTIYKVKAKVNFDNLAN